MNYRFDLKNSQVFLLIGGMVAVGVLLFVVGMLVGASSGAPATEATQIESPGTATEEPAEEPVEAPAGEELGAEAPAAKATPSAIPARPLNEQRIYELQLSAHLDEEATRPVLDGLSSSNLQPYVVETTDSRERTLYTVRLGPWDSMAEAAEAARAFRDHADLDDYEPVIRHRPKPLGPPSDRAGSG